MFLDGLGHVWQIEIGHPSVVGVLHIVVEDVVIMIVAQAQVRVIYTYVSHFIKIRYSEPERVRLSG